MTHRLGTYFVVLLVNPFLRINDRLSGSEPIFLVLEFGQPNCRYTAVLNLLNSKVVWFFLIT